MSDGDRTEDERMDELDALLSARCDGALDAGEAARLEAWLAASPEARARAAELERVDGLLRALAQQPIPEARLDRIEAALARRLATGSAGAVASTERIPRAERAPRRRFAGLGLAAALAAGLVLATLVWTQGPEDVAEVPPAESVPFARQAPPAEDGLVAVAPAPGATRAPISGPVPLPGRDAAPATTTAPAPASQLASAPEPPSEPVTAVAAETGSALDTPIGVAELDLEALDAESGDVSDLEVIEELELLEFLAAREREAGEPQG
ncbi:MAG: hypothetical protein U0900_20670 [Myxococcota bacterium]